MDITNKIDIMLEKKSKSKITKRKAKTDDVKVYTSIKKLMECDWANEDHLKQVMVECMQNLYESNDKLAQEFMKRLSESASEIGKSLIESDTENGADE